MCGCAGICCGQELRRHCLGAAQSAAAEAWPQNPGLCTLTAPAKQCTGTCRGHGSSDCNECSTYNYPSCQLQEIGLLCMQGGPLLCYVHCQLCSEIEPRQSVLLQVMNGSWYGPVQHMQGMFAGIVSNPPYIPSHEMTKLQVSQRACMQQFYLLSCCCALAHPCACAGVVCQLPVLNNATVGVWSICMVPIPGTLKKCTMGGGCTRSQQHASKVK